MDTYSIVNAWTIEPTKDDWIVDKYLHKLSYINNQGPAWTGNFRTQDNKMTQKKENTCVAYKGTKCSIIQSKEVSTSAFHLNAYFDLIKTHMIRNGMWGIFVFG